MKVLIVGGVAGGASAAARLRRLDEHAEIIMFERSGFISYANCGLPYFVGEVITDPKKLTLQTPQSFKSRFNVDVRVSSEVISIDRARHAVTVKDLESGRVYDESYDKLILSPGAKAAVPQIPGIEDGRVFTIRTVEDSHRLHDFISSSRPSAALIVGGGFIGLEAAENLKGLGLDVTLVESMPQLMPSFDDDMASIITAAVREKGVTVRTGDTVSSFKREGERLIVTLASGSTVIADLAVVAAGVKPDTELALRAGLELGIRGSIVTDDRMRTSDPDIYAVGDAVQVKDFVTGEDALISLAGPANRQGRIAADDICGRGSVYKGSQGSFVLKVFDRTAAATGINERAARAVGYDYDKVVLGPASHASYYPGGRIMIMKVLFEKNTGLILGAQIVGFDGVDKRIDVLAAAIRARMTASDLTELDLAYSPPFSSAKDPVNMAGYMIMNILDGLVEQVHWHDIPALRDDPDAILLDTRKPGEYAFAHAEGFINIELDALRDRMGELDRSKRIYVMCRTGLRSYIACRILSQNGFRCFNISGGYYYWDAVVEGGSPDGSASPRTA